MENFKAGDIVQLLSGGPRMTIDNIVGNRAICQWFKGRDSHSDNFPLTSLCLISTDKVLASSSSKIDSY